MGTTANVIVVERRFLRAFVQSDKNPAAPSCLRTHLNARATDKTRGGYDVY
jgi:hypothetical protein